MRIIVLAHGRFGRGVGDRRLRPGHQDPLFKVFVISDLDLATLKTTLVVHARFAYVADVNHIALLKEVAPVAGGHELHLAVANMARLEVRQDLHVVDVHAAVEVSEAVRGRVTVMVGPGGKGRTSQGQTCTGSALQKLASRGARRLRDLRHRYFRALRSSRQEGRHHWNLGSLGLRLRENHKGWTAVPLHGEGCQELFFFRARAGWGYYALLPRIRQAGYSGWTFGAAPRFSENSAPSCRDFAHVKFGREP